MLEEQVLKYAAVAAASKVLSATAPGRRFYRAVGNVALDRMRTAGGLPQRYLDRAERLLTLCERHAVLAPGDRVIELGTGWVHWEATVVALHHDVRVTLYDVWDNRLLNAYRTYLAGYREHLRAGGPDIARPTRDRALATLDAALDADGFEGIYAALGFDYVVEPSGRLERLDAGSYALEVSADVLEHIPADVLPDYLARGRELLRPGGHAIHQIDLVDHYHYFDPAMSPKHYYRYSEATWRRWFENDVQYFNRIQRPQWRELFTGAGFETVEDDATFLTDDELARFVDASPTAAGFDGLSDSDRACLQMLTVHRRPTGSSPERP